MVILLLVALLFSVDAPARRPLNAQETLAFAAVGRVLSSVKGGDGTATLIDDGTLLTAAHLFFQKSGAMKGALEEYAFLTGGGVRCALLSVKWQKPWDIATARVRCPSVPQPLLPVDPELSGPAALVGYHGDLQGGLVAHIQSCHFAAMPDGVLVSNCDGYPVASGSPLLVATSRGWRVAGVMVGVGMAANCSGQPDWFNRYSLLHPVTQFALGNGLRANIDS